MDFGISTAAFAEDTLPGLQETAALARGEHVNYGLVPAAETVYIPVIPGGVDADSFQGEGLDIVTEWRQPDPVDHAERSEVDRLLETHRTFLNGQDEKRMVIDYSDVTDDVLAETERHGITPYLTHGEIDIFHERMGEKKQLEAFNDVLDTAQEDGYDMGVAMDWPAFFINEAVYQESDIIVLDFLNNAYRDFADEGIPVMALTAGQQYAEHGGGRTVIGAADDRVPQMKLGELHAAYSDEPVILTSTTPENAAMSMENMQQLKADEPRYTGEDVYALMNTAQPGDAVLHTQRYSDEEDFQDRAAEDLSHIVASTEQISQQYLQQVEAKIGEAEQFINQGDVDEANGIELDVTLSRDGITLDLLYGRREGHTPLASAMNTPSYRLDARGETPWFYAESEDRVHAVTHIPTQ